MRKVINESATIITILALLSLTANAQSDAAAYNYHKPLFDFAYHKPVFKLLAEQLENKQRHLRFSALTGYREGVKPYKGAFGANFFAQIDSVAGTHAIKMFNLSIEDMLTHGLTNQADVILNVKDPSKYRYAPVYGSREDWMRQHAYCYELVMPIGTIHGAETFEKDLCALFRVKINYEKRMVKRNDSAGKEKMMEIDFFVISELDK